MTIDSMFATVTELLTAFVQDFDEEYSVEINGDFQADNISEKIYYSVACVEESGKAFQENFVKRFPACSVFDLFTLSFMHELGHLETEWDMIDDTNERNKIKDNDKYFALHNEKIATDWAGEYLTENLQEMKKWEEKILQEIKKVLDTVPNV